MKTKNYNKKNISKLILEILGETPKKQYNYKQISKKLRVGNSRTRQLVIEVLYEMVENKQIEELQKGKFRYLLKGSFFEGIVDMTKSGSAYIVSEEHHTDVFVPRHKLLNALHGDTVKIRLWAARKKRKPEGEVLEIIKRAKTKFVGILQVSKKYAFVETTDMRMPYDIFIPSGELSGGKNGQKVIAEITNWEHNQKNPSGKITEVLGNIGENNTEMHAILAEFDLPTKFPGNLESQAKKINTGITPEEISKREDYRNITTFTIDPHDAKDFDDALSIRELKDGNTEVGVHIADVTHYVNYSSEIEEEAYNRATSVYLVDRVIPMLPEHLSNFICSLRPDEEKLCYSVIFVLNQNADVINYKIKRTVIKSDRRFTYEEAQEVIETGTGDFSKEILKLDTLAKELNKKRFQSGAISFDRQEVRFNLDDNGKPLDVYFKEMKDSNKLIEEFMLLANRKVAEFVGDKNHNKKERTFVYRVHDEPNPEKLYNFASFIKRFGYKLSIGSKKKISSSLNRLLKDVHGKNEQNMVEQLAVRSMSKAVYTTENIGHYGLAFEYYTHFTSPIRRYPDMMVHRLLTRYLHKGTSVNKNDYEEKCKHSSDMEKKAAYAERASIKYKQVEFMENKLGSVYEGIISGVTDSGIYVEIKENMVEGRISIRDMEDDFYIYDEKNYMLIGRHSKKQYRLGDNIKIQIVRANLEKRQLDFMLADEF